MTQQATDFDESTGRMLRESGAAFVKGETDMAGLRKRRGSLPGYAVAQRGEMAQLGWYGLLVDEAHDGSGLGLAEMAQLIEELGQGLLAEPLVAGAVLAVRALQYGEQPAAAGPHLQRIATGESMLALAWQEGAGGLDATAIETTAQASANGFSLTGGKRFVAGAGGANGFIVSARLEGGVALFHVDAGASGLTVSHEWRVDGTPLATLSLQSVQVPHAAMLAAPGQGAAALAHAIDDAMVAASAEMLGVARRVFQMTLEYLRTRVQFEKPIGSFQALQHKAVDLLIQQQLAAAVVAEASAALGTELTPAERARIASRCKARCSDAALRITREAVQLHGAIAYTDECDVGLYLKRAMVLAAWLGNGAEHRRRYTALAA